MWVLKDQHIQVSIKDNKYYRDNIFELIFTKMLKVLRMKSEISKYL